MDVNVALAQWSNLLIYSAMAVYAIAFIIYAFDLFGPAFAGDTQTADEKADAKTAGMSDRTNNRIAGWQRGSRDETTAERDGSASTATAVLENDEIGRGS